MTTQDPDTTIVRAAARDPDATVVRPAAGLAPQVDPDATVVRPLTQAPRDGNTGSVVRPVTKTHDPDATVVLPAERAVAAVAAASLPRQAPSALPEGFRLHEYRIDSVLGQGGFGITYLATDVHLHAPVAIKEYLPQEIAFRQNDCSVSPNASRHRDRYRQGLESFLVEARTLASFRHPALVRVARFFEAHRTAYMVLEYEKGGPLKTWWPQHQHIGEKGLVELLAPLCDGLAVLHASGVLHRDIKPDNIQVRAEDGRLVLLDFGSAGQALAEPGSAVAVTPGYAPPEQYGHGEQGPWTDLYSLGATLYWAVTGKKPPEAEERMAHPEAMKPAVEAGKGRYGHAFLKAIDWALKLEPAKRPRDIVEFRRALFTDHAASLDIAEALQNGDTIIEGDQAVPTRRVGRNWRQWLRPATWPLALKMTLAMLATALLPMLLTSAYNLSVSQATVTSAELRYVEQLAHSTAGRVSQFIGDSRNFARSIATDHDFIVYLTAPDATGRELMRDKLSRLVKANPDVQLVMLMDAGGTALVSSDPEVMGRNFKFRQYFQQAMKGESAMTGLVVGAVAGASGMFYAEPVAGDDGQVLGAAVVRMRGSSVARILDEVKRDSSLTPFLVDGDGVLVHHPQPEQMYKSLMPLSAAQAAEIKADQRFRRDRIESLDQPELAQSMVKAKAPGHVAYFSRLTQRPEIAGYAPVPGHDWVVGVTASRAEFEAPIDNLYTKLLWSVLLVGLLFAALALRFARGIVQPIRQLTDAADALKTGDYHAATVPVQRKDEIGQLARTFNVMIDVLRQRERERERRK